MMPEGRAAQARFWLFNGIGVTAALFAVNAGLRSQYGQVIVAAVLAVSAFVVEINAPKTGGDGQ